MFSDASVAPGADTATPAVSGELINWMFLESGVTPSLALLELGSGSAAQYFTELAVEACLARRRSEEPSETSEIQS